jgi:hypothetical protein
MAERYAEQETSVKADGKQSLDPEKRRHVPPKRPMTSNGLHDVTSQKTELFENKRLRQIGQLHFTSRHIDA